MTDMLENNNTPNPLLLDRLNEEDRHILAECCHVCECPEVIRGFGIRMKKDDDYNRFRLIQGSFVAGDNSPQVIKELKHFILKFMNDGRLDKRTGYNILAEIAILT